MLENILVKGAEELRIPLGDGALRAFRTYCTFLEEKNKVMNLTAIHGEEEIATLHFLDSLALLRITDFQNSRVIDIGSGAGFPGIPLLIAEPSLSLVTLDAQKKRISFLTELCEKIGVNAACIHARAEEAAVLPAMRESFDFAVSRAVSRLNVLAELCLPFVKPDGAFLAMKGTDSDGELDEADRAIQTLGGKIEAVQDYKVPGTGIFHRVAVIRKIKSTPAGYPRRFAKIQKAPL